MNSTCPASKPCTVCQQRLDAIERTLERILRAVSRGNGRSFLTVQEAAEIAGCSVFTIRRAIYDGTLPAHKPEGARAYRIAMRDLNDWIGRRPVKPAKDPRLIGPFGNFANQPSTRNGG